MLRVVSPEQMGRVDASMIENQGIPGLVLMEHAAAAVTKAVLDRLPEGGTALIFAGGGNNGGDGVAVLRQLHMAGAKARAVLLVAPESLRGDAKKQYEMAIASGLTVEIAADEAAVENFDFAGGSVIVDALFGTGLARDVGGRFLRMIERINGSGIPVIAVDIPSGVDGATGAVRGAAVRADVTVTFQFQKYGHILYPGRELAGEIVVSPIGLPAWEEESAFMVTEADVAALLPPRKPDSHKGDHGRGALFAGSGPYGGAALLAAAAAHRGGTGLLRVLIPRGVHPYLAACPGAIGEPVGRGDDWDMDAFEAAKPALHWAEAIAIGPGMGGGEGVPHLLRAALETKKPLVIDADGLNALGRTKELLPLLHPNVILTPHPGEMARLTDSSPGSIAADPVGAAKAAAKNWGCTVLLKGASTVIAGERTVLCPGGRPGLAKGGSGDVLTGLLLALLSEGIPPFEAAWAGAWLHSAAADVGMRILGSRMLSAVDLAEAIETLLPNREACKETVQGFEGNPA